MLLIYILKRQLKGTCLSTAEHSALVPQLTNTFKYQSFEPCFRLEKKKKSMPNFLLMGERSAKKR